MDTQPLPNTIALGPAISPVHFRAPRLGHRRQSGRGAIALLAVPCMSILQNTFLHFRIVALGVDAPTDTFTGLPVVVTLRNEETEPRAPSRTDGAPATAPSDEDRAAVEGPGGEDSSEKR